MAQKILNGVHISGTTQIDFMPTHESEGIITLGRYDANTSRYHNIKSYVSSTEASNYLKFSLHNGTTNTVVDVLTLNGNKDATFAGSLSVTGSTTLAGLSATSLTTPLIQLQGDLNVLNKAQTAYITLADRDTSGSEVVYNITNAGSATFAGDVSLADDKKIRLGAGNDLDIYHNGTTGNNNFDNNTGNLYISNLSDNNDIFFRGKDGGNIITALTLDMSEGGNATFAGNVNAPGLVYNASTKYLSISHWSSPPTPAAMLHLSDNSNSLDVPQIRIEGRENPGDTVLDIAVKDADVRFNLVEGSTDAASGYGRMHFKTNASANSSNPTRGGFLFQSGPNSSLINVLDITNEGNATFAGDITLDDDSGASPSIYLKNGNNNFWRLFCGSSEDLTFRLGTTTKFEIDSSGNATFAGGVTIEKSTPTLTFNNLAGGGLDPILEASGTDFNIKTSSVTPLSINLSTQAATFAGTIGSGAITSTGNVTASRLFSGDGGNKTNPMIANGTDEDTGIFFPAANTMAFTAGDTEAFRIAGANATFAGDVTVQSEHLILKSSSPELYFHTTGNHVNWLIAAQESSNATLEFGAIAAATSLDTDASNYTPILKLAQSGAATFAGAGQFDTTLKINAPDEGGAPAMTAILNMHGYEGRGVGIKMRDSVNSASNANNREWFVGTGYSTSGFNIGYASDGSQSSYAAQAKLSISTAGDATFAGTVTTGGSITMPDYIYHAGDTNSYFGFPTNDEYKVTINGSTKIFADASNTYLYFEGSQKLRTTNTGATITGNLQITGSSGDTLVLTKSTTEPSLRIEGDTDKDFVITVSGELLTFTQNDGATDILTLDHDTKNATFGGTVTGQNFYGNQFHDAQDTNYYVNPAGTSVMNAATFAGQAKALTGWFTDNVYLSGGQFYIGASGANATTNDSHRLVSGSGDFSIQSRESGTWTNHLYINSAGVISGDGSGLTNVSSTFNGGTVANATTFSSAVTFNNHVYGRSVNNQYSNLYKFGGLYFTWDSDSYGTAFEHSLTSSYGGTFNDSITLNSYNHIRFNIDSNNNNGTSYFEVGDGTTGTGNVIFRLSQNGNVNIYGTTILPEADSQIKIGTFTDGGNNSGIYDDDDILIGDGGSISIFPHRRGDYGLNATTATSTTFRSKLNIWSDNEDHITFGGASTHMVSAWESWKMWINNDSTSAGTLHLYNKTAKTEFARLSGSGTSWINGTFTANTDLRAPLFYDSNDTTYYVNPASRSNLGDLDLNSGAVWDATTQGTGKGSLHLDPNSATDHAGGAITFGASDSSNGTTSHAGIYVRSDGSYGTRMYFSTTDSYATGSKTAMHILQNGQVNITRSNLIVNTDVRAPLFYDSNNTGYYTNPAGLSQMHTIDFDGALSGTNSGAAQIGRNHAYDTLELKGYGAEFMIGAQHTAININYRTCNNGASGHTPTDWYWRAGSATSFANMYMGQMSSSTNARAPIFYDSADTSYYLDPGLTGLSLKVAGKIEHKGLEPTSGTNIDQIKEFSMTFQLAANTWTDTGIDGTDLTTGTYAMRVLVDDYGVAGEHYAEYYSAMISWEAGSTNSTSVDEIITHRAGHAPNNGDVQFRTQRALGTDSHDLMLQVKHNKAYNAALDASGSKQMKFYFRRLI